MSDYTELIKLAMDIFDKETVQLIFLWLVVIVPLTPFVWALGYFMKSIKK